MPNPDWFHLYFHKDENSWLYAVHAGNNLISWNDGDVCNAAVTEQVLQSFNKPICVDIGVDEGWWSSFCLNKNSTAQLYAFEPNPISVKKLYERFTGEPRIRIIPKGVSNTDEGIPLILDGSQSNSRKETETRVLSTRLDFVFEEHPRIHILKIDTEGHEFVILNSLAPYLANIDTIIFEFTPRWYGTSRGECIERSIHILEMLNKEFKFMCTLSRRGVPVLSPIETEDGIYPFVIQNYLTQTDIVCSRSKLQLPPFEALSPPHPGPGP